MSKSNLVMASIILAAVTLSCTFIKDRFAQGTPVRFSDKDLPVFDPKAPLVSPGAIAVRRLAEIDPGMAAHAPGIEAAERAAMTKARDELANLIGRDSIENTSIQIRPEAMRPNKYSGTGSSALMLFQSADQGSSLGTMQDTIFIASLIGGLKHALTSDQKAGSIPNSRPKFTETVDGATTTITVEVGSDTNGSTTFGMSGNTESVKNGVKVTTEFEGKIEGSECPNAEGQVQLTVKIRFGAGSASNGFTQDLTAFVRATVDDNADISSITVDVTQATQRSQGGRTIFVETGERFKADGPSLATAVSSNLSTIQRSDSATNEEVGKLSAGGHTAALATAKLALDIAERNWKNGGCVKINAISPGSVAVNSSTQIPVKVVHKIEGGEVPSKLDAALTGEASVDPTNIPRTPGTLTYIAPGETGKSATIQLTAASRRGRAVSELTATTASNSYQIVGGLDDWKTNSQVCDIMKPFQLKDTYGIVMDLSGGLSGTYTYKGQFQMSGTGTYTITLPNGPGRPGTMVGTGPGSAMGHTGSGTENYTLTPIPPCT